MPSTIRERQTSWTTLTEAADEASAARNKAEQQIEQIKTSDMYADDYKAKLIQQQRDGLEQTIRDLMAQAQTARDNLLDAARELDAPAGDTTAQLLAETRAQRAWARIKAQLDAGVHWSTLLDQAVAAHDGGTVLAMRAELPAYVQSTVGADAQVDAGQLGRALDIATFRALGDDRGPGTAARLRLHVETRWPIAEGAIEQALLGRDLTRAMSIEYAKREAAAVDAKLDGQPEGDREQFAGAVARRISGQ